MEELLIRHCAPTLAGLKTGSLFACACRSDLQLRRQLRNWNKVLLPKGLQILALRFDNAGALLYLYRAKQLRRDLAAAESQQILEELGYNCESCRHCLRRLVCRLGNYAEFPHEIGLFLGYPPEDVRGFMANPRDCKCSGCWKVYGDAQKACTLFQCYQKCTACYCASWAAGYGIERLIVAG